MLNQSHFAHPWAKMWQKWFRVFSCFHEAEDARLNFSHQIFIKIQTTAPVWSTAQEQIGFPNWKIIGFSCSVHDFGLPKKNPQTLERQIFSSHIPQKFLVASNPQPGETFEPSVLHFWADLRNSSRSAQPWDHCSLSCCSPEFYLTLF